MKSELSNARPVPDIPQAIDRDDLVPLSRWAGHARYTHQLSDETTDAISRVLVRVVPLAFGALMGSLAYNTLIGVSAAIAISIAFDLSMQEHSIVRRVFRRLPRA